MMSDAYAAAPMLARWASGKVGEDTDVGWCESHTEATHRPLVKSFSRSLRPNDVAARMSRPEADDGRPFGERTNQRGGSSRASGPRRWPGHSGSGATRRFTFLRCVSARSCRTG